MLTYWNVVEKQSITSWMVGLKLLQLIIFMNVVFISTNPLSQPLEILSLLMPFDGLIRCGVYCHTGPCVIGAAIGSIAYNIWKYWICWKKKRTQKLQGCSVSICS